jgi:hypothetical protein
MRPIKAIFDGPDVTALGEVPDDEGIDWGGGIEIPSSDDVVLHDDIFDSGGLLLSSIMPPLAISETFVVGSAAAMIALDAQRGDVAVRTDVGKTFILSTDSPGTLGDWIELLAAGTSVVSVNGYTGVVVLNAADVGALTQAAGDARYVQITNAGAATLSATGDITLSADSDANAAGAILLKTAGTTKWTITNSGVLQAGTAITTGALPGAIVLPNATSLWGANAANGAPYRLIQLDATDFVRVDVDGRGIQIGGPIASGSAPLTYRNISLTATLTGNVQEVGFWCHPTVDSSAVTAGVGIDARVSALAGVYNITDIYGIHILNPSLGAGVTATRITGLLIDSQSGATTNLAIQTNGTAGVSFGGSMRVDGAVGQGVASQTTNAYRIGTGFTLTGGTNLIAYNTTPTFDVSGTTSMSVYNGKITSAAGSYTTSDAYVFRANSPSLGAGHTVTRLYGVYVDDQTVGGTSYAIRTNLGMVRFGDRVGVGGDPTSFGLLDLQSTTQTIIIPRMTTTQKNAMTATNGMLVYDSSLGVVQGYQSGVWTSYGTAGGADNVNIAGVFFNVDSDASDATNVDSFIWGRDRLATAGGTTLMTLNASGYLLLGTTLTTSVAAFDIVIPNTNFLRAVNAAGTDTKPLIGLGSTDVVLIGSGNVRVQSGIFMVNTTITSAANSGDIVLANQRGLRILDSGSTTAYIAIDRTTNGTTQSTRIDPSALGVITIGAPGYIDDGTAGDLILAVSKSIRIANAAGTATIKVLTSSGTGDVVANGTNSLALQTAATERVKIDSAGNVLFFAGAGLGGGALVISIHNATTDPTTNPAAGGILYASGGALKWRGSSGTVTTIAPA